MLRSASPRLNLPVAAFALAVVLSVAAIAPRATMYIMNHRDLTQTEVHRERLYIAGDLNAATPAKIKRVLTANPGVTTLVLTAMPGSLDDEALFPFASWIRSRGLNTHLTSRSVIASGAVDLFLAGTKRTMEKGAILGVHSWSDGDRQASDFPRGDDAHRMNADYIAAMLGKEDFYWFTIFAAPADGMHWMTQAEIDDHGLLTEPVQGPGVTPIPTLFHEAMERERRELDVSE